MSATEILQIKTMKQRAENNHARAIEHEDRPAMHHWAGRIVALAAVLRDVAKETR